MASEADVQIIGDRLLIRFTRYDLSAYDLFLRTKKLPESAILYDEQTDSYTVEAPARFAGLLGLAGPGSGLDSLGLPEHLFDYQRFLVRTALDAKRYAIWADCGLGKTAMFLEYSRQVVHRTGGRVLILSPLSVIPQTVEEARRWYGDGLHITTLRTREDLGYWCKNGNGGSSGIAICNYEKFVPGTMNELRHLAGLILDESSILKTGGGVIKWNLVKSARGIEYKLSCTATPAPNEIMEYASQAAFLEKLRSEGEILWTYFRKIGKSGVWEVKPYSREAFFRFMAGWSIYLRNPASYGWADNLRDIPPPTIMEHPIEPTKRQRELAQKLRATSRGLLFDDGGNLGVTARIKLSQIAKGFLYRTKEGKKPLSIPSRKPEFVADLAVAEVQAGRQTLIWTLYDQESELILNAIGEQIDAEVLSGAVKLKDRASILERFRTGQTQCLISKASLLGFGMNFQHCRAMIFSGMDDSYERFYQAVRRAYRYGQTESVRVHIPFIPELEGVIYQNVLRKKDNFERETAEQESHYRNAMEGMVKAS